MGTVMALLAFMLYSAGVDGTLTASFFSLFSAPMERVSTVVVNNAATVGSSSAETGELEAQIRWGEEYMEEAGMGYAPASGSTLYEWARTRGENTDFLFELGLLGKNEQRGTVYDFYRGRLVVPIRDKQRRTVGFTARDVTGQSEAKYLNSRESPAYSKREHVFGIDIGWRAALKKDQWRKVSATWNASRACAAAGKPWRTDRSRFAMWGTTRAV